MKFMEFWGVHKNEKFVHILEVFIDYIPGSLLGVGGRVGVIDEVTIIVWLGWGNV